MTYYRLRDIKTPPFAYVINREEAIKSCALCQMPFPDPEEALEIEIFTTDTADWMSRIKGRPMMADLWLIGDKQFRKDLEKLMPGMFDADPVKIVSWMTRNPGVLTNDPTDILKQNANPTRPQYFCFRAKQTISLDSTLLDSFPAMRCHSCKREIPDIPLEYQRLPELSGKLPMVASLEHFHLEGYDYLFHEDVLEALRGEYPEMMLEELVGEPLVI